MSVTIFHNPSCGTSRKVLAALREAGIEPDIRLYLKQPPSPIELKDLLGRLGMEPRALMRRKEKLYKELGLDDKSLDDKALIEAMSQNPSLIERPIVIMGDKAVLCRPPEKVAELLG